MKRRNIFKSIALLPFLPFAAKGKGKGKKVRIIAMSKGVYVNGVYLDAFHRVWPTAEACGMTKKQVYDLFHKIKRVHPDRSQDIIANALKSVFTRLSRESVLDEIYNITGKRLTTSDCMLYRIKSVADLVYTLDRRRGEAAKIKELAGGVFQWFVMEAYWQQVELEKQAEIGRWLNGIKR